MEEHKELADGIHRLSRKVERRQHRRYPLYTAVTLKGENENAHGMFWVKDLSRGGALLFGRAPLDLGAKVRLVLHLPWYRPVQINARVVRRDDSSGRSRRAAVSFIKPSSALQREIDEAIRAAERCSRRERSPTVLLITDDAKILGAMESHFHLASAPWVHAETPLDVVQWLQDWEVKVDTVIIDLSLERFNVLSMLSFLCEEYAAVRRFLITTGDATTLERVAVTCGNIDGVLRFPVEQQHLDTLLQH